MKRAFIIMMSIFIFGFGPYTLIKSKEYQDFNKQISKLKVTDYKESELNCCKDLKVTIGKGDNSFFHGKNVIVNVRINNISDDKTYDIGYFNLEVWYKGQWHTLIPSYGRSLALLILKPQNNYIVGRIQMDTDYSFMLEYGRYRVVVNAWEENLEKFVPIAVEFHII